MPNRPAVTFCSLPPSTYHNQASPLPDIFARYSELPPYRITRPDPEVWGLHRMLPRCAVPKPPDTKSFPSSISKLMPAA